MPLLSWNNDYRIGNGQIDAEHRELFSRINAFSSARDKICRVTCAMRLYQYIRVHFEHEEALMRTLHYPEIDAHIQQHHALISQLNGIATRIANDMLDMPETSVFLSAWVLVHIKYVDGKLAAYVRQQNQEPGAQALQHEGGPTRIIPRAQACVAGIGEYQLVMELGNLIGVPLK